VLINKQTIPLKEGRLDMIINCLSVTAVQAYGLRPDGGRNEERGRAHQPGQTYHTP
jgi:hypothetical protein